MRPMILLGLLALVTSACGEDPPELTPDADPSAPDAAACTGAAYDPCTDTAGGSDCLDGMECRFFMGQGFTICTPTCDANTPCPDQDGTAISCNMMGRCRGTAPNDCAL